MTDIGTNDLKHAALDKNARILLIYNERKEVIAFSVLNRNGEVVIITSVEYDSQNKEIEPNKLLQVIKKFSNELYEKINNSNDRIRLITIGASSKIKPEENIPFPSKYPTPVCADEDKYQANGYHYYQHILFKDDSLNYAELKYNSVVNTIIEKNNKLEAIMLTNKEIINIDGLFIYIGSTPNINFLEKLNLETEHSFIKVDKNMQTSIEGIYAVGDVIKKDVYQLTTATSDATIAAISIKKKISK